jgi:titin
MLCGAGRADAPGAVTIVSAASFQAGPIAPGEVVTVFGTAMGPASPVVFVPDASGRIGSSIAGVRLLFNGIPAPILYASFGQVSAIVPAKIPISGVVAVQAEYLGTQSAPLRVATAPAAPGLFTSTQDGRGQVAAINQDGSINSRQNPAPAGSIVAIYLSGGGATQPASEDGAITGNSPPLAVSPVTAAVGGQPADVMFAGSAPALVSGVFQVNVLVPAAAPSGNNVFLSVAVAGAQSQAGTTLAITGGLGRLPDPPSGLHAVASGSGVVLGWNPADPTATRVHLEKKTAQDTGYTEIALLPAATTAFSDSAVAPAGTYFYRIRLERADGYSDYSPEVSVVTAQPPPPQSVTATAASASQIVLSWTNAADNGVSVLIERRTAASPYGQIASLVAGATTYQDSGLAAATQYFYRLRVAAGSGTSGYSPEVSATTLAALIPPPQSVAASAASASQIVLSWTNAAANAVSVLIERRTATSPYVQIASAAAGATTYQDSGLAAATQYFYRLRVTAGSGTSGYSQEVSATTLAVAIASPQNVSAAAVSSSQIGLSWTNAAANAVSVLIERRTATSPYAQIASVVAATTTYQDSGLAAATQYFYRLRVATSSGTSGYSQEVSATTASSVSTDAVPRRNPSDPHRLSIGGATWYPVGYYPSLGALTSDNTDYTYYTRLIDQLAANGINYFRNVFAMGQPYGDSITLYNRTGPGTAADGRPKFDLNQFNQSYLDYWRAVISYARSKGVVVQICLLDGWHLSGLVIEDNGPGKIWGAQYDYYYKDNNVNGLAISQPADFMNIAGPAFVYQQALVRKAIDALGDLPNIIWESGNETGNSTWDLKIADYITQYEQSRAVPIHLVMPRDLPGHQFVAGQCDNTPGNVHGSLASAYSTNQVLITDNDCAPVATPDVRRGKAWAALTAGAHIDYFHPDITDPAVLASTDAQNGMRYLGYLGRFLMAFNVNLAGMSPLDSAVTNGWAFGRPGQEFIVYLPTGGSTSLMGLAAPRSAKWFNPRDGSTRDAGTVQPFTAPDSNDWVLYVLK